MISLAPPPMRRKHRLEDALALCCVCACWSWRVSTAVAASGPSRCSPRRFVRYEPSEWEAWWEENIRSLQLQGRSQDRDASYRPICAALESQVDYLLTFLHHICPLDNSFSQFSVVAGKEEEKGRGRAKERKRACRLDDGQGRPRIIELDWDEKTVQPLGPVRRTTRRNSLQEEPGKNRVDRAVRFQHGGSYALATRTVPLAQFWSEGGAGDGNFLGQEEGRTEADLLRQPEDENQDTQHHRPGRAIGQNRAGRDDHGATKFSRTEAATAREIRGKTMRQVFSRLVFRDECRNDEQYTEWIEPLVGILRHPLACDLSFDNGKTLHVWKSMWLMDASYVLPLPASSVRRLLMSHQMESRRSTTSSSPIDPLVSSESLLVEEHLPPRRLFLDAGATRWGTSPAFFTDWLFKLSNLTFTEFHGWEPATTVEKFLQTVPELRGGRKITRDQESECLSWHNASSCTNKGRTRRVVRGRGPLEDLTVFRFAAAKVGSGPDHDQDGTTDLLEYLAEARGGLVSAIRTESQYAPSIARREDGGRSEGVDAKIPGGPAPADCQSDHVQENSRGSGETCSDAATAPAADYSPADVEKIKNLLDSSVDYVLLKLDIDTPAVEQAIIQKLLSVPGNFYGITELAWEHHVQNPLMQPSGWGDGVDHTKDIADSLRQFQQLRHRGIRAHSWI
ncbi:unnamed protein product [Amoebophrya sp. A120]|nr:unnamed protein product [Amoebophrya sp. A120]|eukprot:GSA120T00015001001.1